MSGGEAKNIKDRQIKTTEKEEFHEFEITPPQILNRSNEMEDSIQLTENLRNEAKLKDAESNAESDNTDFLKITQYEKDIKYLRRYLNTQIENNDFIQLRLKSLTEKLEKSEGEVRKLECEAKLAAFEYDKLFENYKKYEIQIDLNNKSIADLNAQLSNQLVENKLTSSKIEHLYKEMRKNERELKKERDDAITKLLQSNERLVAEKGESSRCKQELKSLKEQAELQKKNIGNSQVVLIVVLLSVTTLGVIGWILFFVNNFEIIKYK